MKLVICTNSYEIADEYTYIAFNNEGILCGFVNAPVRDFKAGQWVDSVTGSTGEMILFKKWDQSSHEVASMRDMRLAAPGVSKRLNKKKGTA